MIVELPESAGTLVAFRLSGTLSDADYKQVLLPAFARASEKAGRLSVVFELADDFHGWDVHAIWDDAAYGVEYWGRLGRFAVIGDKEWETLIADLIGLWPGTEARFFHSADAPLAWAWARQPIDDQLF